MSAPTGPVDDDAYWRRPDPLRSAPDRPAATQSATPPPPYAGPPRADPPPPGWRPPTVAQLPPPRALPPQDEVALDEAEQAARTLTYGVALVAGAILLVVMCLLGTRVLF
ncbi:MAG TPA: translation initiation factor 2 [Actinoplanes sp.]|nr:translation initiation factor 2 [Actinoplanes sp.]